MKRKILLPTDFSENAWQVITDALGLNKNDSCYFYISKVISATSNIIGSLLNMEPRRDMYETAKLKPESGLSIVLDILAFRNHYNPKHLFKSISTFNHAIEAIS